MDNSWKWIIKRHWVELCLADVVTNIAEILKRFFQQVTRGCLAAKSCHTQRSNAFHANARKASQTTSWSSTAQLWWCSFLLYWIALAQGYIILPMVIPHLSPGKNEKLQAGGRGQSVLSCSPSPGLFMQCPPAPYSPMVLVHRAHLLLSSRNSLIGLIFSHTNLSGVEKEILESSTEWVGLRWPIPWNQSFEKHDNFLCPSCRRAGSTPKNTLANIVIAWSAMACFHHLFGCRHFFKRTWSWARLQVLQDTAVSLIEPHF